MRVTSRNESWHVRERAERLPPFTGSSLQKGTRAYVNVHKVKVESASSGEGREGLWQVKATCRSDS